LRRRAKLKPGQFQTQVNQLHSLMNEPKLGQDPQVDGCLFWSK
jgi:hypothetical protein